MVASKWISLLWLSEKSSEILILCLILVVTLYYGGLGRKWQVSSHCAPTARHSLGNKDKGFCLQVIVNNIASFFLLLFQSQSIFFIHLELDIQELASQGHWINLENQKNIFISLSKQSKRNVIDLKELFWHKFYEEW